jgi:tape measure domain-containing protein
MATDVERLVVSLEASITKFDRTMQKALGITNASMQRIEKRQQTAIQKINSGWEGMQRGIAVAFAGVAATRGAVQLVDAATRIENSLKVVGLAGEELERVYDALYASAQRNMAPLETLTTLFSRLGLAQKELGVSTDQLLSFTDNVALALRVQGTTSEEARGALIQLSQAMGSGIVRAEEFNSVVEGAPSILRAAAAGLKEADGSVAKLRQIVIDGKLSSEAFFHAFQAGAVILEEQVANAQVTVEQQFVRLQNVLIDVAREMNEGTDVSVALGDGIANLADIVREMADLVHAAVGPIQTLVGLFEQGAGAANAFANEIARISGAEAIGAKASAWVNDRQIPGLSSASSAYGRVLTQTFELVGATAEDTALAAALAGKAEPEPLKVVVQSDTPQQVSLSDFKAPTKVGGGGGGGGRTSGERYAESLADFERRISMLNEETALMSTLNPLLQDYGYAKEKLQATQELENAAKRAGIELDTVQRTKIEELAHGYATATAEAARLAEAQDKVRQAADDMASAGRQALDSIIDGFLEGKDAGEILNSVMQDLLKNLIKMGINAIGGGLFGGGGGGIFGAIGSMFGFAKGTANTGGRRGEARGVVHGQEAVIPLPAGGKVPVIVQSPQQSAQAAQPQALTVHVVTNDEKMSAYVTDHARRVVGGAAPALIRTSVNASPAATAEKQLRYGMG